MTWTLFAFCWSKYLLVRQILGTALQPVLRHPPQGLMGPMTWRKRGQVLFLPSNSDEDSLQLEDLPLDEVDDLLSAFNATLEIQEERVQFSMHDNLSGQVQTQDIASTEYYFFFGLKTLQEVPLDSEQINPVQALLDGHDLLSYCPQWRQWTEDAYLHIPNAKSLQKCLPLAVNLGKSIWHLQFRDLPFRLSSSLGVLTKVMAEALEPLRRRGSRLWSVELIQSFNKPARWSLLHFVFPHCMLWCWKGEPDQKELVIVGRDCSPFVGL